MRNQKKIFITLTAILLLCVCVYFISHDQMAGMQYQYLSVAKQEKLMAKLIESDELDVALAFRGEVLPYHEGEHTYYLPVDKDNAGWEIGTFSARKGVEVFFLSDFKWENKAELVAGNKPVPFMAVDDNQYMLGQLVFTGMPMISFQSTDRMAEDGNPLFDMVLYEACSKEDWTMHCLTTATIRGNTSREYEKKSLRLKLKKQSKDGQIKKENKNLLGIRKDDDWILNSLYADNSRIRDKLCMELWDSVGAHQNPYGATFGVMGEYAEVVINNGYAGLYLLMHPIDAKQLHMKKTSTQLLANEEVVERIYKKKYTWAWNSEDFVGDLVEPNLNNYRGGYFLKGDVVTGELSEWKSLYDLAECIESEDESFRANLGQLADVQNIADNWLFFQAIGGFDNENKNVYYIARNRNQQYYGYFIPWDMNLSFGSVYADNEYYSEESMDEVHTLVNFQPGMRMLDCDVENSRSYVQATWKEWRNSVFDTRTVLAHMDNLQKVVIDSGAMSRELVRWPASNATTDISLMKNYAKQRLAFVDDYIKELDK